MRNLTIELHRLIAPSADLEGDNLALAKSLGINLKSAPNNLKDLADVDDDNENYLEFVKCPVCGNILKTENNRYIICTVCKENNTETKLEVPVASKSSETASDAASTASENSDAASTASKTGSDASATGAAE